MKHYLSVGVVLILLLVGEGQTKAGVVYNNAADFSTSSNPNGVWSYGDLSAGAAPDASTFSLYTYSGNNGGIDFVSSNSSLSPPLVDYNPSSSPVTFGTVAFGPHQAGFHPGPNGEYSVYRFTAPTTGVYAVSATFSGLDFIGPTTTDVHVLDNGASLFSGEVTGYGPSSAVTYTDSLSLAAGDRIDFVVGYGTDGAYGYDSTGLDATLTFGASATPEPASLTLLGLGGLGLTGYGWRRRRLSATA